MNCNFNEAQLSNEQLQSLKAIVAESGKADDVVIEAVEFPDILKVVDIEVVWNNQDKKYSPKNSPEQDNKPETSSPMNKSKITVQVDDVGIAVATVDMLFMALNNMTEVQRIATYQEFSRRLFSKFFGK